MFSEWVPWGLPVLALPLSDQKELWALTGKGREGRAHAEEEGLGSTLGSEPTSGQHGTRKQLPGLRGWILSGAEAQGSGGCRPVRAYSSPKALTPPDVPTLHP